MNYDVEYLAGLDIAPKDGKTRLLRVPFLKAEGSGVEYFNNVLLALQGQGYEVVNAYPVSAATASVYDHGYWILYR